MLIATPAAAEAPSDGVATSATAAPQDATVDLWSRTRAALRLPDHGARSEVRAAVRVYARDRELARVLAGRAGWLLPFVIDEAIAQGLPAELAFLAVVESKLDPTASSGGNVGLWQFQGATARLLGLQTGPGIDEREDAVGSTRAAYRYLARLHRLFDGDWLLALVAYNIGDGRLQQLRARNPGRSVWELPLPAHTRHHLARLAALWSIVRDPSAAGVQLPSLPGQLRLERVTLDTRTTADDLATNHGGDSAAIALFNAQLGRGPWPAGTQLWVPRWVSHEVSRETSREATSESAQATEPAEQQRRVANAPAANRYRIAVGDSLWRLARRFGVSVSALRDFNALRSDALRVGDELAIPPDS